MCMMLPKAWVLIIVLAAKFLHPGPGYGGSCFPKDTLALVKTAEDHHQKMSIVESVVAYNDARKTAMAQRVIAAMGGKLVASALLFWVWHLSRKPMICVTVRHLILFRHCLPLGQRWWPMIQNQWVRQKRCCQNSTI